MKRCIVLFCILLVSFTSAFAQTWFPFSIPWDDDTKTDAAAADLLVDFPGQDPALVVDSRGFVRAGSDGHFYFEKTGRRARFFGVNFTFNASFPPCPDVPRNPEPADPGSAPKVARHLAKLGVNVVRFHHMDYFGNPDGIFDRRYFPNDTQHLDPDQLRRFDYLVYHLRRNGIYANINLKVARHFGPGDGVPDAEKFKDPVLFFQGVSHYNARMIELQKDYARQLLTHRNPYTGLTYAEDPGVFCVEIANEDSLFGNMLNDGGLQYLPDVASIPERYSTELDQLWNSWLVRRYGNHAALAQAWAYDGPVVNGADRVRNGGFENGMAEWGVWPIDKATVNASVQAGDGVNGSSGLRLNIQSDGVIWHVQAAQSGHSVEEGKTYEVSFYGRASQAGDVGLDLMLGVPDWSGLGLSKTFRVGTTWARYSVRFKANRTESTHARITFELGASTNTIWLDDIEFREVGLKDLETGENLNSGTVRRPVRSELGAYTPERIKDLFRFYSQLDEAYFVEMRRYLKEELGVQALVTGTAPWWTFLGDTAIQSKMDFVDAHFYWDHPYWVGVPAWSPTGWRINNRPLVNQLDELSSIACQAVRGKPFSVSEFNQPFPNRYALEAPLLLALYANLQDWDAIYMFDYAGSTGGYASSHPGPNSYFSVAGNAVKTGQLPIASRIFVGNQSSSATEMVGSVLSTDDLAMAYAQGIVSGADFLSRNGLSRRTFMTALQRIDRFQPTGSVIPATTSPATAVTSSNLQLSWNAENPAAAFVRVDGDAVEGAVGFIGGRTLQFTEWTLSQLAGAEHAAVLLQAVGASKVSQARRLLLSVWTESMNTGGTWSTAGDTLTTWGTAPHLLRAVQFTVALRFPYADSVRLWALDSRGQRTSEVLPTSTGGELVFRLDISRDKTVWYALENTYSRPFRSEPGPEDRRRRRMR